MIGKKQVIALTEDNNGTTDRNKILQIVTKFFNDPCKVSHTRKEKEKRHPLGKTKFDKFSWLRWNS